MKNVIEATDATFEREVLDRSHSVPVVVDFWAGWCGPCRSLTPVLEKLADEAAGSWQLVKVDVDSNPMVAQGFRIQGIPAVKAFKDGKLVAEFTGALPEQHVRTWLQQLGPTAGDVIFDRGRELEAASDLEGAAAAYRDALSKEPSHQAANMALARVELARRAGSADVDALRSRLEAAPDDVETAIAYADARAAQGDIEAAVEPLLEIVRTADGEVRDRARMHVVGLLATLPPDDQRAVTIRRALSRALF